MARGGPWTRAGTSSPLFGTLASRHGDGATGQDEAASRAFRGYLGAFVKSGDPNGGDRPHWARYDPLAPEIMQFTHDRGPVFAPDPWLGRLTLVERNVQETGVGPIPGGDGVGGP